MTLVVARVSGRRVVVASDTQLTEHDVRLPIHKGVVKTYILPGGICVSFSNSPELAIADFQTFAMAYPEGTDFINTSCANRNRDEVSRLPDGGQIQRCWLTNTLPPEHVSSGGFDRGTILLIALPWSFIAL